MPNAWFHLPDRPGNRALAQQLLGLDPLFKEAPSASVLDVGCAEGLIAIELAKAGAEVHGIEIIEDHIAVAKSLAGSSWWKTLTFERADAQTYKPARHYDIVLLLAVLHKFRNPSRICKRFARVARKLVVMRLPAESGPVIIDQRSDHVPHDMAIVMELEGFRLEQVTEGPFQEWTAYWRRNV